MGKVEDHLGPPGPRCHTHGGWSCNVAGCTRIPMSRVSVEDCFGPPGIRCRQHNLRKNAEILKANKLARRRRAAEKRLAMGLAPRRYWDKGCTKPKAIFFQGRHFPSIN